MKGFIRNETDRAVFKLQRSLPINGILTFENAYLTLGEKSGKDLGYSFIKWLKENYFQDEGWVFYKAEGVPLYKEKSVPEVKAVKKSEPEVIVTVPKKRKKAKTSAKGAGKRLTKKKSPLENQQITASNIVESEIELAKILIKKTKDRQVLKRALSLTSHFSKKEEHRRFVMQRLDEVY